MSSLLTWYQSTFAMTYEETLFTSTKYKHLLPWTAVTLYVLMLKFLPGIMKGRGMRDQLKYVGFIWNLALCALSFAMMVGVAIPYTGLMLKYGFWTMLCDVENRSFTEFPTLTFWAYTFALSKYAELIDTVLLILKKPERFPLFLHWYHHLTVLLFTWYAEMYHYSAGHYFIVMNSIIHFFMYWYYAWAELGHKAWWAKYLTTAQIAQMIFGIGINTLWMWGHYTGKNCSCSRPNVIIYSCLFMYASYFLLFVKLYLDKYDTKKKGEKSATSPAADKPKKKKTKKID